MVKVISLLVNVCGSVVGLTNEKQNNVETSNLLHVFSIRITQGQNVKGQGRQIS